MVLKNHRTWTVLIAVLIISSIFGGCASRKPAWGDAETGFMMTYRLAPSETWTYQTNTEQNMMMEMMGRSIETTTEVFLGYHITGKGKPLDSNIQSDFVPDSMRFAVRSEMGDSDYDLSTLIGKSFGFTFSPLGEKIEFSDPENIEIDLGQMGGKRTSESFFRDLLPDLPEEPIKIGGSWTVKKEEPVSQGGMDLTIQTESTHTVQGIETINGIECLKIVSKAQGVIDGSGQQMGADITYEGDVESESVWYFAYKKGMFIQTESKNLTEGSIAITGPQDMTLPMSQETTTTVRAIF